MASKKAITFLSIITVMAFLVPGVIGVVKYAEGPRAAVYPVPDSINGNYYYHKLHWIHVFENKITYLNLNFEKLWSVQVKYLKYIFVHANSFIAVSTNGNESSIYVYSYNGTEVFRYTEINYTPMQAAWDGKHLVLISVLNTTTNTTTNTTEKKAEIRVVSSSGAVLGEYTPNWNTSTFDFRTLNLNRYYSHPIILLSSIFLINYDRVIYAYTYTAQPLWNRSYGYVSLFVDSSHIFVVNGHALITLSYSGKVLWNRTMLTNIEYIHVADGKIYVYFSTNEPHPMVEILNDAGKILAIHIFKYITVSKSEWTYEYADLTDTGRYIVISHFTKYGVIVAGATYDFSKELWSVRVYYSSQWDWNYEDNVYCENLNYASGHLIIFYQSSLVGLERMHGNSALYLTFPDTSHVDPLLPIFTIYWLVLAIIDIKMNKREYKYRKIPGLTYTVAVLLFGFLMTFLWNGIMFGALFLLIMYTATPKYRGKEILFSLYYIPYAAIFLHYYPYQHPWEYVYLAAGLIATFAGIYLMDLIYEQNQSLATAK